MGKYLLKRILIFIPTLFIITLLSFIILLNSPGDPVERMLSPGDGESIGADRDISEKHYLSKRKQLGLDRPVFYFSVASLAECDTLHHIARPHERTMLSELTAIYGNWPQIQEYYRASCRLEQAVYHITPDSVNRSLLNELKISVSELKRLSDKEQIALRLENMLRLTEGYASGALADVRKHVLRCGELFEVVQNTETSWKNYVPSVHFYGLKNQYHQWVTGLFTGDLGISYTTKRPVLKEIGTAIRWSLLMNILAIFIAYAVSIPLGVFSVRNRNTGKDRAVTTFLFVLYSLPGFWVATLLITFLCNPEYLHWFPTSGVADDAHSSAWSLGRQLADYARHLFLPMVCYTYTSFAFLSRQMRAGMMEVISQDYIRTARAKGLSERVVIWRHALRNSLIPLITHFANIFPALVGGSVIVETIFSIPGMGMLSINSIFSQDYPTLIAIFTLGAILTLVGILVSDLLYALVDPRITFSKK